MSSMFAAMLVAVIPPMVIGALLKLSDYVQRRRDARLAMQVELTDALHRELGAVVAPFVERRRGGRWIAHMEAPLHDPELVMTLLTVTDQVFARHGASNAVEVALTPRLGSVGTVVEASRPRQRRAVERVVPMVAAAR